MKMTISANRAKTGEFLLYYLTQYYISMNVRMHLNVNTCGSVWVLCSKTPVLTSDGKGLKLSAEYAGAEWRKSFSLLRRHAESRHILDKNSCIRTNIYWFLFLLLLFLAHSPLSIEPFGINMQMRGGGVSALLFISITRSCVSSRCSAR